MHAGRQRKIAEMLRDKDEVDESLSLKFKGYDWISANKDKFFIKVEEDNRFVVQVMKQCVKPCLTNNATTVISNEENECFTNCMSKGAAVGLLMQNLNADADIKRYGGFKA